MATDQPSSPLKASSQFLVAGAPTEYMRPESPDCLYNGAPVSPPSSPVLAHPKAWIHAEQEAEYDDEHESYDNLFQIVPPLSSSPPEQNSSSPHSARSTESEDNSSSLTSSSSDTSSHTPHDGLLERNSLLVNVVEGSQDFLQRLNYLLEAAQRDRSFEQANVEFDRRRNVHSSFIGVPNPYAHYDTPPDDANNSSKSSPASFNLPPTLQSFDFGESPKASSEVKKELSRSRSLLLENIDTTTLENESGPDISPIRFSSHANEWCGVEESKGKFPSYRVIKRSQSYLPLLESQASEPPCKRQKTGKDQSAHAKYRIYARRTASLRRAESLKSFYENNEKTPNTTCLRTLPVTPVVDDTSYGQRSSLPASSPTSTDYILKSPVPIIAPPENHLPSLPLSEETLAKMRLMRFLEREGEQRATDGFSRGISAYPPNWMPQKLETDYSEAIRLSTDDPALGWEAVLGLGRKRRLAAINWILDVLPASPGPPSSAPSSQISLTSSTSTMTSSEYRLPFSNLLDQLQTSRETRFHAAWMFLRYFYLTMSPNLYAEPNTRGLSRTSTIDSGCSTFTEKEGRELITWDIIVGCLSLSVKLHRDFLEPLLPVYAPEYLSLAPHAMSSEDLETAHRDILAVFDYSLGVTPQPVMDELWFSLPSLRGLLDFDGGWYHAMEDAWLFLFDAVCEPDVQRFPISLLATVAVMDGVIESLVHKHRLEEVLKAKSASASPSAPDEATSQRRTARRSPVRKKRREALEIVAREEAEGVLCDIQSLVGISDVQLSECRTWMNRL